VTVLFLSRYS